MRPRVDLRVISSRHLIVLTSIVCFVAGAGSYPCWAGTGGIFPNTPRKKFQVVTPLEAPASLKFEPSNLKPSISIPSTPGTIFFDDRKNGSPSTGDAQVKELEQTLSGAARENLSGTARENLSGAARENLSGSARENLSGAARENLSGAARENLSGSASVNRSDATGSVESFFQIDQTPKHTERGQVKDKHASHLLSELDGTSSKPKFNAPYRFFWHVLDNAGVPMFIGKTDSDLDPSLRAGFKSPGFTSPRLLIPAELLSGDASRVTGLSPRGADASVRGADAASRGADAVSRGADASARGGDAASRGADAASRGADASARGADVTQCPHKIPESELEGTDSWVKDDVKLP